MTHLTAKQVIKNKYWIVEEQNGDKVATIQAIDHGGFVYVQEKNRVKYPSISLLSREHNIVFESKKPTNKQKQHTSDLYGYPITGLAYNAFWDVKNKNAIFTKKKRSKCFFSAGYFAIKLTTGWTVCLCPKMISLNRYEHVGPFKTIEEANSIMEEKANELDNSCSQV